MKPLTFGAYLKLCAFSSHALNTNPTDDSSVKLKRQFRSSSLSLSTKRLYVTLLLFTLLTLCPQTSTAQTAGVQFARGASTESVKSTARDKAAQPNLSIGRSADHATGRYSFFKWFGRGVVQFGKTLFSAFGEGGNATESTPGPSRCLQALDQSFPRVSTGKLIAHEVNRDYLLRAEFQENCDLVKIDVSPKFFWEHLNPAWKEPEYQVGLLDEEYTQLLAKIDQIKPLGALIRKSQGGGVVTNATLWLQDRYARSYVQRRLREVLGEDNEPARVTSFTVYFVRVLIDAEKPMVYLNYVCQNEKSVYLRMHNNTVWHIDVTTGDLYSPRTSIKLRNGIKTYAAPNDKEISLHYFIHTWALPGQKVNVPEITYPDNGFSNWIASQDSILFSVPVEYLRKDLQVVVKFNYEWQITKQGYSVAGSEHQVSFRGIDLAAKHHQHGRQSCNPQTSFISQQKPGY